MKIIVKFVVIGVLLIIVVCLCFVLQGGLLVNDFYVNMNGVGVGGVGVGMLFGLFEEFKVIVGDMVLFQLDQLILMLEVCIMLVNQVGWLNQYQVMFVVIQGYVDEQGMWEYNFVLGVCWVNLVQEYLIL